MRPALVPPTELDAFLLEHSGWSVASKTANAVATLERAIPFERYGDALAFVVALGAHAERVDHHPRIVLDWGQVTVEWSTHDAGGITALDLAAATSTDALARRHGARGARS